MMSVFEEQTRNDLNKKHLEIEVQTRSTLFWKGLMYALDCIKYNGLHGNAWSIGYQFDPDGYTMRTNGKYIECYKGNREDKNYKRVKVEDGACYYTNLLDWYLKDAVEPLFND